MVVARALKLVYTTDAPHVKRGLIQNDFVYTTLYAATLSVYFRNNICSRAGDICAHVGIHITYTSISEYYILLSHATFWYIWVALFQFSTSDAAARRRHPLDADAKWYMHACMVLNLLIGGQTLCRLGIKKKYIQRQRDMENLTRNFARAKFQCIPNVFENKIK